MVDDKFKDWAAQLRVEMMKHSPPASQVKMIGTIIDAMIPYRLGRSPDRAARALLCVDTKDYGCLKQILLDEPERQKEVTDGQSNQEGQDRHDQPQGT